MPPVTAPADRRFRRAHVKPSGRRGSRARQVWTVVRVAALVAATAYAAWRGVALAGSAPVLQVSRISVTGNDRLSSSDVLALLDGLRGRNIVGLSLEEWQERLLASPWVEQASLRRVLPSTVEVHVRERRPIGIGRIANTLYLVDAEGVVMDEYGPAYADIDLPIVDGLAAGKDREATVDEARARLASRVAAALAARPEMARLVSQIDVSDPHDAVVMLEGDTTLLRLGEDEFVERLQQYLDLGDALRERVSVIDYVDLRFAERVYVKPARGATTVAPASSARR